MTTPVRSLEDFFATYLALVEAGDAEGLGALYADQAVMSTTGSPSGDTWAIGRNQIVEELRAALATATVDAEVPPTTPYERRGDDLAARFGTFRSTVTDKTTHETVHLEVEAVELYQLSATAGWQYLSDQTRIVSITTPRPSST